MALSRSDARVVAAPQASWMPMITIVLGQVLMSFNVASLPVALGGMVKSFHVPPTTIATGIVTYSMLVAGFVCVFRGKSSSDSNPNRPVIPGQIVH